MVVTASSAIAAADVTISYKNPGDPGYTAIATGDWTPGPPISFTLPVETCSGTGYDVDYYFHVQVNGPFNGVTITFTANSV
jgi:hypothetical protein